MSKILKDIKSCGSGRDYLEWAQEHEDDCPTTVTKIGSYQQVRNGKGSVMVPDTDRALPKPTREYIATIFKLIGLAALILAVYLANGGL